MNRLCKVLLSTSFLALLMYSPAQAADINVRGNFEVTMQRMENVDFVDSKLASSTWDDFAVGQYITMIIDASVRDAVSATLGLSAGGTTWGYDGLYGSSAQGGGIGNRAAVNIDLAYLDFMLPFRDGIFRFGIQEFMLPATSLGSAILDDSGAGVQMEIFLTDEVDAQIFWVRPLVTSAASTGSTLDSSSDFFGIVVPMEFELVEAYPWFMYGRIGDGLINTYTSSIPTDTYPALPNWEGNNSYGYSNYLDNLLPVILPTTSVKNAGNAFAGGIAAAINPVDMLLISLDANYSSSGLEDAWKREGYYFAGLADYIFDWGTPGAFAWYASGDNSDVTDGSERMASLAPSWGNTGLGFSNQYSISYGNAISTSPAGTWGAGLQIKDLQLIDKMNNLSHQLVVAYYQGTNNTKMAGYLTGRETLPTGYSNDLYSSSVLAGMSPFAYLTENDSAVEITFNSTMNFYRTLQSNLEFSYIIQDFDEKTWATSTEDASFEDAWKLALNLKYSF